MLPLRSRRAVLLGIASLLLLALAGGAVLLLAPGRGGAGRLTVAPESLDFGRVDRGAEPRQRLRLRNEGRRTVVIASIQGTCACILPDPGWRKALSPGEETEVVVRLASGMVPPQKLDRKALLIASDDEQAPTLVVPVAGEIEARVTLSPPLVKVGTGDAAGHEPPRRLRLRTAPGYRAVIDRVEILRKDWFEVREEEVPDGWDLHLTFKPDPERRGPVDTFIRVHATVTGGGLPPQKYDDLIVMIQGNW